MDDPTRSPAKRTAEEKADFVLKRTRRGLLKAAVIALAIVLAVITALIRV